MTQQQKQQVFLASKDAIPLATKQDAMDFYKCSLNTIDRLIQSGELKIIKIGRSVRLQWSDLKAFAEKGGSNFGN